MEHTADLTGITLVALAALLCGMAMARLRQPAIVGYILAGVILGPTAFGVVESQQQIGTLAELGVLLLLFLVGMELSVRAFMVTWRIAATAVALQVGLSVTVMMLASWLFGFSSSLALLLGFFVALSSTAVAIKMLEEISQLHTRVGRITVSILIAQDLAFLPMLLVVDFIGEGGVGFWGIIRFVVSIALLVMLMGVLKQRRKVNLPFHNIFVGHADLSPLTGLAYCFGAAAFFGLAGFSAAYGAFLAGLFIGNSAQRKQMHAAVQPVQSILVMVFFLSIGLLIDLGYIWDNLGTVLLLLLMVTLFKTAMNVGILRVLGESWQRAFLDGVIISQIGEFSFLLAASGLAVGAIDADGARLAVAVTVLSLMMSPFWLTSVRRVQGIAARSIHTLPDLLKLTYMRERVALQRARGAVEQKFRREGSTETAESPDAESPDAELPDAALPDAASPDAESRDGTAADTVSVAVENEPATDADFEDATAYAAEAPAAEPPPLADETLEPSRYETSSADEEPEPDMPERPTTPPPSFLTVRADEPDEDEPAEDKSAQDTPAKDNPEVSTFRPYESPRPPPYGAQEDAEKDTAENTAEDTPKGTREDTPEPEPSTDETGANAPGTAPEKSSEMDSIGRLVRAVAQRHARFTGKPEPKNDETGPNLPPYDGPEDPDDKPENRQDAGPDGDASGQSTPGDGTRRDGSGA